MEGIDDKTIDSAFIQETLSELVKSAGFDFSGEVERSFGKKLDLGLFTRIPVVPGRLKYKAYKRFWGVFEQQNAFGIFDETNSYTKDYGEELTKTSA